MPEIFEANPETIRSAAEALRRGELVACPTDTVFGLAADATNPVAVAAVFKAKGRSAEMPLPVMVADPASADQIAAFSDSAGWLADTFWPGALTMVLPLRAYGVIAPAVTAGLVTIALRVPDHPVLLDLLKAFGGPLAVTSANISGDPSAITVADVADNLGENVAVIIEGDTSPSGVESTIVAVEQDCIRVLRAGAIPGSDLARVSGLPLADA